MVLIQKRYIVCDPALGLRIWAGPSIDEAIAEKHHYLI
jgi:hypothetical protein